MENSTKLIPANIKPEFLIPEKESIHYWMRGSKLLVDPRDPVHLITRWRNFPLREVDFLKYWGPKVSTENQIGYMKAAGYATLELINDPALNPKTKVKPAKPVKSAEHIYRENRRIMTIGEAKAILKEQE